MKTLAAVVATALVTGGAAYAATGGTFILKGGQAAKVGSIECVDYPAKSGNGFTCSKPDSNTYVTMAPAGVAVTRNLSAALWSSTATIQKEVAAGDVDLYTNWHSGDQLTSKGVADTKTISQLETQVANLTASLSSANQQLQTAKTQLAEAQTGAVGAIESEGLSTFMGSTLPALGQWFQGQGGDFTSSVDQSDGFADYDFDCLSCAP